MKSLWDLATKDTPGVIATVAAVVTAVVYLAHGVVIAQFAVDAPWADEWETFVPGGLVDGFSLRWLLAPHNEHRIVPTKLLTWLLYELTALDYRVSASVTYLAFGAAVVSLIVVLRRALPRDTLPYAIWFAPFALSPINHENLSWGFQSHFHLYVLFLALAVAALFGADLRWRNAALGAVLLGIGVFSFSSGIASALVVAVVYVAFRVQHRRNLGQLPVVLAVVAVAVGLWLVSFNRVQGHGELALPTSAAFWNHYLNLIALGFGALQKSAALGAVCLAVIVGSALAMLVRRRADAGAWMIVAMMTALLAAQAAISLGRGHMGAEQAKSSRYAEYGLMLLPLCAGALAWALQGSRARLPVLAVLWALCFGSFWKEWTVDDYREEQRARTEGLACLRKPHEPNQPLVCPGVYPFDVSARLDIARAMNVSFTRGD